MDTMFPEVKGRFGFGCMRRPMTGEEVDLDHFAAMTDRFLAAGFNYFDTAHGYISEKSETAIRACLTSRHPREAYILTDKLSGNYFETGADIRPLFERQLAACGVDYFDFYLLHAMSAARYDHYTGCRAFEIVQELKAEGKIRSIGLSNWYVEELEEFLPQVSITPALVQNEIHPYYQENEVIPYIQDLGIVVQGWYPLGGRGHTGELLGDEVISGIAKAHGVSSAQVILRWNLQKGVVVIPGSSNPDHIKENTELYHFELTDEEMAQINALDRNEKHDWY